MNKPKARLNLEHQFGTLLKEDGIDGQRLLVGVSGGLDSMVLARLLWLWQKRFNLKLVIAHVHHGHQLEQDRRNHYRDLAQSFVESWASQNGLEFVSNVAVWTELHSEGDLRDWRRQHLENWRNSLSLDQIVLAQHADDLIETRVMRLIRGTGPQGTRALRIKYQSFYRPLLRFARSQIEEYATTVGLEWISDPSNLSVDPLRNWIRKEWLPALEKKRPGSVRRLGRSLRILAHYSPDRSNTLNGLALRRAALSEAPIHDRREMIAGYFRLMGVREYGETHVEEFMKMLSQRHKSFVFVLLNHEFHVTPDCVWASRV